MSPISAAFASAVDHASALWSNETTVSEQLAEHDPSKVINHPTAADTPAEVGPALRPKLHDDLSADMLIISAVVGGRCLVQPSGIPMQLFLNSPRHWDQWQLRMAAQRIALACATERLGFADRLP
jgi:hypothetical protein